MIVKEREFFSEFIGLCKQVLVLYLRVCYRTVDTFFRWNFVQMWETIAYIIVNIRTVRTEGRTYMNNKLGKKKKRWGFPL